MKISENMIMEVESSIIKVNDMQFGYSDENFNLQKLGTLLLSFGTIEDKTLTTE
ncbi:hypothetical protein Hdeb2414_s0019g00542261 [Helianthus debilis subsp. tardiflorus]